MEKWGVEANTLKEDFDVTSLEDDPSVKVEKPKIGHEVPLKIMQFLEKNLNNIPTLFPSELIKLDQVLVEQFRFFSIIDKNVRLAIYKSCEFVHYTKSETLVENDVNET
jgi:hypothetical protein